MNFCGALFRKNYINKYVMHLPQGKMTGNQIENVFSKSIEYHLDVILNTLKGYDAKYLYNNWRLLIRCIDEFLNIPMELNYEHEIQDYLNLKLGIPDKKNTIHLTRVLSIVEKSFGTQAKDRFYNFLLMVRAIDLAYKVTEYENIFGNEINLSDVRNSLAYFQSRRVYYNAVLCLIPHICQGQKKVAFIDLLNQLHYPIEACLVGISTAYYNLLVNNSLLDYEMESDGKKAIGNFSYSALEGFFLEPQRLSLLDQLELRHDTVAQRKTMPMPGDRIFSFNEIANTLTVYDNAFNKYHIEKTNEYKELTHFFTEIAVHLHDDFNVIINTSDFTILLDKYSSLKIIERDESYFAKLNSFAPFQKSGDMYYSTVPLLSRFASQTLSLSLLRDKSFQINSGFVFEDKVSRLLKICGFIKTDIKRINRKEFDLITIKRGRIYNFQCKNNIIDVSRVDNDYKKIGRLNRMLCAYYEKSLQKEKDREQLIIEKTGIKEVEHYIVSRYPVITRNSKIINFKDLELQLQNKI